MQGSCACVSATLAGSCFWEGDLPSSALEYVGFGASRAAVGDAFLRVVGRTGRICENQRRLRVEEPSRLTDHTSRLPLHLFLIPQSTPSFISVPFSLLITFAAFEEIVRIKTMIRPLAVSNKHIRHLLSSVLTRLNAFARLFTLNIPHSIHLVVQFLIFSPPHIRHHHTQTPSQPPLSEPRTHHTNQSTRT